MTQDQLHQFKQSVDRYLNQAIRILNGDSEYDGADGARAVNDMGCDCLDLIRDYEKIRKALVNLVGESNPKSLEGMEAVIRVATIPDEDRANTINAIHAIRDTA